MKSYLFAILFAVFFPTLSSAEDFSKENNSARLLPAVSHFVRHSVFNIEGEDFSGEVNDIHSLQNKKILPGFRIEIFDPECRVVFGVTGEHGATDWMNCKEAILLLIDLRISYPDCVIWIDYGTKIY